MTRDLQLPDGRLLPARLLSTRFVRSGGPGGQNVNKVASKVDLRLDFEAADEVLTAVERIRLRARLRARLDAEGLLQVIASTHREQGRNVEAALQRMETLLAAAITPRKRRKPTRPSKASKERRLREKKQRSERKRDRGTRHE